MKLWGESFLAREAWRAEHSFPMYVKSLCLSLGMALLSATSLFGAVQEKTVAYQAGDTPCEGFLAFDDSTSAARPGVLVVHDWMGLSDHTKAVCRQLAQLGYVAFAADIYGKGVRPADAKEAGALAGKYK